MRHCRSLALRVSTKENRRAEYPLERCDQPAILGTALPHSENIQHFCCAAKRNGLFLLSHGKRREKNGHQPILTSGNAVLRMAGDLQQKLAVPAFVHQCTYWAGA